MSKPVVVEKTLTLVPPSSRARPRVAHPSLTLLSQAPRLQRHLIVDLSVYRPKVRRALLTLLSGIRLSLAVASWL